MIFRNSKHYDAVKFLAQVVLPAAGTLYFALSQIWAWPYGEAVVGTISAIDAFLGALLGISSAKYYAAQVDPAIFEDQEKDQAED